MYGVFKSLLAAVLLLVPAPVLSDAATEQVTIPVDNIARAKFPKEDAKLVDGIAELNRFVNSHMVYTSDQPHYGHRDFWVMAPADGKGDCEDYALTKLFMLSEAGFPTVTNTKIVSLIVHVKGKIKDEIFGHAILAVLLPNGAVAYLDMTPEPMTRAELEARGYQFFDWKA